MITSNKLIWMRQHLLELSTPSPEWWTYVRKLHIDLATVLPHCGSLAVTLCRAIETADGQYIFEFDPGGVPSVVIEAPMIGNVDGLNDYVVKDLVAWPIGAPEYFATAMGPSAGMSLLGPVAAYRASSDSAPLLLYRNPETWLMNGCQGSVVLKPEAALWLNTRYVPLICEDKGHATEISRLLGSNTKKRDIFIPDTQRAA